MKFYVIPFLAALECGVEKILEGRILGSKSCSSCGFVQDHTLLRDWILLFYLVQLNWAFELCKAFDKFDLLNDLKLSICLIFLHLDSTFIMTWRWSKDREIPGLLSIYFEACSMSLVGPLNFGFNKILHCVHCWIIINFQTFSALFASSILSDFLALSRTLHSLCIFTFEPP